MPLPRALLDRVRIHDAAESWIGKIFVRPPTAAQTHGDDIYVRGFLDATLLRHELEHVRQYEDAPTGVTGFMASYLASYVGHFAESQDAYAAYTDITEEREARRSEGDLSAR